MSEQPVGADPGTDLGTDPSGDAGPGSGAPAPRTGNPVVDRVLRSLDDLSHRPVGEHAAVFEAAHEALRAALDETGDDTPAGRPGLHG